MSKIKNIEELNDFFDVLDEFIGVDDIQFSFEELSAAANTFLEAAKGKVATQKTRAKRHSQNSGPLDTFDMMVKQPSKLTRDCFHDFGMIEECVYSQTAHAHYIRNYIRG